MILFSSLIDFNVVDVM